MPPNVTCCRSAPFNRCSRLCHAASKASRASQCSWSSVFPASLSSNPKDVRVSVERRARRPATSRRVRFLEEEPGPQAEGVCVRLPDSTALPHLSWRAWGVSSLAGTSLGDGDRTLQQQGELPCPGSRRVTPTAPHGIAWGSLAARLKGPSRAEQRCHRGQCHRRALSSWHSQLHSLQPRGLFPTKPTSDAPSLASRSQWTFSFPLLTLFTPVHLRDDPKASDLEENKPTAPLRLPNPRSVHKQKSPVVLTEGRELRSPTGAPCYRAAAPGSGRGEPESNSQASTGGHGWAARGDRPPSSPPASTLLPCGSSRQLLPRGYTGRRGGKTSAG